MKAFRFLHRWHKRLGVLSAVIVIMLIITGIMLNHTERLQLDSRFVQNETLLNWYQLGPSAPPVTFYAGDTAFTQLDQQIFMQNKKLAINIAYFSGAVDLDDTFILAGRQQLIWLDDAGELIDEFSDLDGVPAGVSAITQQAGELYLRAAHGVYHADLDALTWTRVTDSGDLSWPQTQDLPADQREALLASYRGNGLPLERVLLDLHSGRLFGSLGVILVDLAALLLGFLALSGFWMWWTRR